MDGQQRIRAIIGFLEGAFDLDAESPVAPGTSFEDLSAAHKKKIFEYSFVIRLLPEMPDEELRAIFQRINKNTVTLNAQELRHATYWGPFIQTMEEISNFEQWGKFGIFTANDLRRMLDVEYISELAIAHLNGLQNKKKNLEDYYQQYETEFDGSDALKSTFIKVLGELDQILPELSQTRWKKKSDFYTLFLLFAKHSHILPLNAERRSQAADTLRSFASNVDLYIWDLGDFYEPYIAIYARAVQRAASDLGSRRDRENSLVTALGPVIGIDNHA